MEDNHHQFITDGASLTRPPGLAREYYPYWKDKRKMYIKSTQYRIWLIITNGDIPRPEAEWTNEYLAIMELSTKSILGHVPYPQYNKICRSRTTKEIQDLLSINYGGIGDVRLRKVKTLTRHCESFTIKDGESVDNMFGRLQVLMTNLEALGQMYFKAQIILKVLNIFPKVQESKTTTTQEARDF